MKQNTSSLKIEGDNSMKFIFRKGKVPIKVFAKNEHKPKQRSIDSIVEGDDGADEIMHPD